MLTIKNTIWSEYSADRIYIDEVKSFLLLLLVFIAIPFAAFIYSLFSFKNKSSQIVIVLFIALFGYNMVAESEEMDLYRYHLILQEYNSSSFPELLNDFFVTVTTPQEKVSETKTSEVDLYVSIVCALLSRVTSNGHILMGCFGLIYGLAMVAVMKQFLAKQLEEDPYSIIIILCASFAIPLYTLAGVRYGTATFFFIWGIIANLKDNNYKSWILILISCFTHFAFVLPAFIFLLYAVLLKKDHPFRRLLYIFYFSSFFLPDLLSLHIDDILPFLGNSVNERVSVYNDPDTIEAISNAYFKDAIWFMKYQNNLVYWISYIGIILLKTPLFKLSFSERTEKVFYWTILFMTLVNFSISIPDLGIRLKLVSFIFFFYYLSCIYNENRSNKTLKCFIVLTLLFNLLKIVVETRMIIEYTTAILFFSNIYYIITDNSDVSLWTLIKNR